jgi:hypothetical protein
MLALRHRAASTGDAGLEPGWEAFSCRCRCQLHRARVVALFRFLVPWAAMPRVAAPGRRRGPTPSRSRSRARPCRLASLAQLCTPARACLSRRGPGRAFGPFPLASGLSTLLRPCSPCRHGRLPLARGCRKVERPPWVVSCTPHRRPLRTPARIRARPRVSCLSLSFFALAQAPPRATPPRRFAANSGPKSEPLAPPRPCAPKRVRARAFAPNTGARPRCRVPPPRRRRVPTMAPTSPRRSPPSLFVSFKT